MRSQRFTFLLLSGGVGTRASAGLPKQFRAILGRPMISYAVAIAAAHPQIAQIITNAPAGFEEMTRDMIAPHAGNVPFQILRSGATRQHSVALLLEAAGTEVVILHEAARPCIDGAMIDQLLDHSAENVGLYGPIPFSMCRIGADGYVTAPVPRDEVFDIQLPQKFNRADLQRCHQMARRDGLVFTEDSQLCHHYGARVQALPGAHKNIKVTYPEDFGIAGQLLKGFHA
ncbi:IspD/TarI family cytidylyltransferase [Ketogulonicigenium vulgare]|uniref:IspD/TarI family cytidylyltransferase n=1 Tax=Ketogulonicigenium vulgare TaxID=92945 RepID=UPI0002F21D8C|nr:IspD/TarI family cytidylyltransferase [Ketogulonicigenium vulgare]